MTLVSTRIVATKLGLEIELSEFRRIVKLALDDPWRPDRPYVR